MFGRWELLVWRCIVGAAFVLIFVWGFVGYVQINHTVGNPDFNNSSVCIDAYHCPPASPSRW